MKDVHELEIYACIDGYPNYLVTSHGRVLSLKDCNGKDRIKELKHYKNRDGYLHIVLCNKGKMRNFNVHRLVAQAFIPNPYNKPQVNHIDENKENNNVSNLEWVTVKENNNHGTRNKRSGISISKTNSDGRFKGEKHINAKPVVGINEKTGDIKFYKYINECEKDGFHHQDISKCCKGKLKTAKGCKWYYAKEYFNKEYNEMSNTENKEFNAILEYYKDTH